MEELLKKQKGLQKEFEIIVRNFNKTSKSRYSVGYLKVRLEMLDTIWKSYRENFLKGAVELEDNDKFVTLESEYAIVEDQFSEIYGKLSELIRQMTPTTSSNTVNDREGSNNHSDRNSNPIQSEFKLPRITIPKFDGTYVMWNSFKDLFVSLIHNNNKLSPVQKFHYLKSNVSGDAEQMLRHLQMTDDNYMVAWQALTDRYDNKRMLVDDQLSRLMAIPKSARENTQSLQHLLDTTNECLASLKNLGMRTDDWDPLIVFITVRKLPVETYRAWETKHEGIKEVPTYKQLKEFLEGRYQTLQRISAAQSSSSSSMSNSSPTAASRANTPQKTVKSFHKSIATDCAVCQQQHTVRQCPKFLKFNGKKRRELIQAKDLCLNCLSQRHKSKDCKSSSSCYICSSKHHTLLHSGFQPDEQNSASSASTAASPPKAISMKDKTSSDESLKEIRSHCAIESIPTCTLLPTALVKTHAPNGETGFFRALIDQGSQASFISESAVQSLNVKRKYASANINGLSETRSIRAKGAVSLTVSSYRDETNAVHAELLVIPSITTNLPSHKLLHIPNLVSDLELADPKYQEPGKIDLLLGADVYPQIILEGMTKRADSSLIAQKTIFGWIISGPTQVRTSNQGVISLHTTHELDSLLRKFWELEEVNTKRIWTNDEKICENIYITTTKRDPQTGRYIVRLPFKDPSGEASSLGRSREQALKRFQHLENKLARDAQLSSRYHDCIKEYLDLGHMAEIPPEEKTVQDSDGKTKYRYAYLPHHGVLKESSTTTKLRVVFDASAKTTSGVSLNDELLVGPTIQDELIQILLRWRTHRIAFTADVEKMYRQIRIVPEHAAYQRILWRSSPTEKIKDYELLTVTFGTSSAPFLAIRTLHQLAEAEASTYPVAAKICKRDFYVDDLMTGADTIEEAVQLRRQLTGLTNAGGCHLRKWVSNHREALTGLSEEEIREEPSIPLNQDDHVKALGILWQPKNDVFHFKINFSPLQDSTTKRKLLSDVARLFDPLGWLAPVVITAKVMMQSLWHEGLTWDEKIPANLQNEWQKYQEALPQLENIRIPRWLETRQDQPCELHGFSDASENAYAAALYVRVSNGDGSVHVNLLTAKTRVAPVKKISIPRLELCGAVLLARLVQKVRNSLQLNITATHAWSDSTITLAWIRSSPSRWKCFVANRVTEIISTLTPEMWHHVKSEDNPADCASRGLSPKALEEHILWWKGPDWLGKPTSEWPDEKPTCVTNEEHKEKLGSKSRSVQEAVKGFHTSKEESEFHLFKRYSSLTKLIRITTQIRRYLGNLVAPESKRIDYKYMVTAPEQRETLQRLLQVAQREAFESEINHLRRGSPIPDKSKLKSLHPYVDAQGLLRIGGRLQNANIPSNEKHPVILSPNHQLTKLIIAETHQVTQHGGPQLMLAHLRRRYWILDARNALRRHCHRCMKCFRQAAETSKQLMGQLPSPRVSPARPFTHTGVDYAGPIDMRVSKGRGTKSYKGYIALFVCLCTKAIHLEAVSDLTTEAFLAAFRRFVARRGLPSSLYSDRGTNFVGAERQLKKDLKNAKSEENAAKLLANEGVEWNFIPPASPHFGGLWEAGVKSMKHHMKRVIGNSTLTYEELTTVLCQIEASLNSRPLCPLTNDPSDLSALTPGHFLIGTSPLTPPEPQILDKNENSLTRWQLLKQMHQNFWARWSREYLGRLQQRPKWTKKYANLKPDALVLVKDERFPPSKWPLGRIIEVHQGQDNLVRVVTVKTANTTLTRPVTKICALPELDSYERNEQDN